MKIPSIRDQRGFTLIEIIMVIVLLGIIAAIAIPKYVDLKSAAVSATLEGLKGGLAGAGAIGYADKAINTATATYPTPSEINTSYLTSDDMNWNAGGWWTSDVGNTTYTFTYTQSTGAVTYN